MKQFVLFTLSLLFGVGFHTHGATRDSILPAPTVVTVTASNSDTAEGAFDPGVFTIHRTGNAETRLLAFYRTSGTATPAAITKPVNTVFRLVKI